MKRENYDVVVIGGGPAGIAAALSTYKNGISKVLILERNPVLGGVLNQCIHDGFGIHRFGEALTGPEYAARYIDMLKNTTIKWYCDAMVTELKKDREIVCVTPEGIRIIQAKAVILAMGCRERTRGAISIAGTRPAGIYTAGVAQQLLNLQNIKPGKRVVILGSGDIGLIMARRMTLEGMHVECVLEKMEYCNGLPRNKMQCLEDYQIPLYLSETVIEIRGRDHLEQVVTAKVDKDGIAIEGTERIIDCDILLLSVGLIPENELSEMCGVSLDPVTQGAIVSDNFETNVEGIFACGNVLHVHDLVDNVSEEAAFTGKKAAMYVQKGNSNRRYIHIEHNENIRYLVPQKTDLCEAFTMRFRVGKAMQNKELLVMADQKVIAQKRIKNLNPAEMQQIDVPACKSDVKEVKVIVK